MSNFQKIMNTLGWYLSDSGGGCAWYTKPAGFGGFFWAITDVGGCSVPNNLDDPVSVGLYNGAGDVVKYLEYPNGLVSVIYNS